jgi:cation diffusion facilitator CzcD-associated flavoprotein CzcO
MQNVNADAKILRYAIIGAGMSGILAAIKLHELGEASITVYEKEAKLGGTWRDNRYPGLTCDTPSHAYSYSFALNPDWRAYYATGTEINAYFTKVAEDFGIMPMIRFSSEVQSCRFDEVRNVWQLALSTGEQSEADVVIVASGVLHHPNIPDLPGLDNFAGKTFHSARWDDSAQVDGTHVGIIGSGSTGTQLVNALSKRAARAVQFQRSPQWIMPVPQFSYSPAEREAFHKDPTLMEAIRNDPQYWANIYRFTDGLTDFTSPQMAEIEDICRQNLEQNVADPILREKLRPDYPAGCKRLIYSWEYYECVQRPCVYVETGGIDRIVPEGVRMQDGTVHSLDVIILATGFKADQFIRPATVTGRAGLTLDEFWEPRPTAHYAVTLPSFPNLFMLNGPTSPVGNFPLIDIAERQWAYIEQLLEPLRQGTAVTVEPTREAHAAYEVRRIAAARKTIFGAGCTNWYLDKTGIPSTWPWGYQVFADAMAAPVDTEFHFEAGTVPV